MTRREQIIASDTLARAIESRRLATTARERAVPGSVEYEEAIVVEELLNALVVDLVRRRNRTALWPGAGVQARRGARECHLARRALGDCQETRGSVIEKPLAE